MASTASSEYANLKPLERKCPMWRHWWVVQLRKNQSSLDVGPLMWDQRPLSSVAAGASYRRVDHGGDVFDFFKVRDDQKVLRGQNQSLRY